MQKNEKKDEINVYRVGKMTVLELMAVLAVLGILVTWVLRSYFA